MDSRPGGEFDRVTLQALTPLASGLAIAFSIFVLFGVLLPGGSEVTPPTSLSLVLVVAFVVLRLAFGRRWIGASAANPAAFAITVVIVLAILVTYFHRPDPFFLGFLPIIIIGTGSFLLSYRWLALSVVVPLGAWGLILVPGAPTLEILRFTITAVIAVTLAVVICVARRRGAGRVTAAVSALREELERGRALERSLRKSESRLELAIESSRGGWWEMAIDPDSRRVIPGSVSLSAPLKRLIGFGQDKFPDDLEAWRSRVHPDDLETLRESAEACQKGNAELHEVEYRIQHRDGHYRWFGTRGKLDTPSHEGAIRFSGIDFDVTDRVEAESENRKLAHAVEVSPTLVIITNPAGDIEYVNSRFTDVTGYESEEVLGKNPRLLKSPSTPREVHEDLWKTITGGEVWRGEFENLRKNAESYWAAATISPIWDKAGAITQFIAMQEDITSRKEAERQRALAERMESLGQLVSGVAHDFNNLVTIIVGFSELLKGRMKEGDPGLADVEEIRKAGESAASLTQKLLAFSRQQVVRPRDLDLNLVIRELKELLQHSVGESIQLKLDLDPDLMSVRGDRGQMEQVLVNLAVNARDAMPTGGSLVIETKTVEIDESYVSTHPPMTPGSYCRVTVSDTGTGMNEATMERIFEPFFTTKGTGTGTGMGLATVYGILKQNSGFIWVYSEMGCGTTFRLYLPASNRRPEPMTERRAVTSLSGKGESILLVEDNDGVRRALAESLQANGYEVLTADSASEALRVINGQKGAVDLIISDVVMPEGNGLDLVDSIIARGLDTKTLLVSGHPRDTLLRRRLIRSEVVLLNKPFSVHELLAEIRQVLDQGPGGSAHPGEMG